MPKVSVIIPVYGVEKYIERCARNLFEQTLDDIEFIFVDDCTKDNSIEILKQILQEYPSRIAQTRILRHEINKGLPQARRTGIEAARGEYIAHCDSDDWPEKCMYEDMYEAAKKQNADIAISNIYLSSDDNHIPEPGVINPNKYNILSDMFQWNIPLAVWNKLVKRDLYISNEIYSPVYNIGEDMVLMVQLIYHAKTFVHVSKNLYHYYNNPNSMCRVRDVNAQILKFKAVFSNLEFVLDFLKKHELLKQYKQQLIKLKYSERNFLLPAIRSFRVWILWMKTYPELAYQVLFCPLISFRDKLKFVMIYLRLYPFHMHS